MMQHQNSLFTVIQTSSSILQKFKDDRKQFKNTPAGWIFENSQKQIHSKSFGKSLKSFIVKETSMKMFFLEAWIRGISTTEVQIRQLKFVSKEFCTSKCRGGSKSIESESNLPRSDSLQVSDCARSHMRSHRRSSICKSLCRIRLWISKFEIKTANSPSLKRSS